MEKTKTDVALIIIFNHRYDKNFDTIEHIYKGRFSNIFYLVPFYDGIKKNVIPVYGRSIFFQGYIAQGFNQFFNERFKHYFFVADDMIINPKINENNYELIFKLQNSQSFIPSLSLYWTKNNFWIGRLAAYYYNIKQKYVEIENEIPSKEIALKAFERQGLEILPIKRQLLFGNFKLFPKKFGDISRMLASYYTYLRYPFKKQFNLSYPLTGSYSDIAIVSSDSIKQFCHYCGVFAASSLFAEVAIPSALVLSSKEKINTESDLDYRGRSLWAVKEDLNYLENNFKSLNEILTKFPQDYLYLHPVKLSKWK